MTTRNPFMDRVNGRDSGHHGRKAEGSLASRLKGTLQPGSGALAGAKGDVKLDNPGYSFLVESKTTKGASIGLTREWCLKIYQEALEQNRHPAIAITFTYDGGISEKRDRWVMVPEHIFSQLVGG